MSSYTYTQKEEFANALTHAIGALLSLIAITILISYAREKGNVWGLFSVIIYGMTMILMYMSSTIVHTVKNKKRKEIFLLLDHSSIFLFIAGCYTPITLLLLEGTVKWTLFILVWSIALIGIVFKIFFLRKFMFFTTFIYILLGWLVVIAWEPLISSLELKGVFLLVIGGICYSIGTIFYLWRGFPYHHAIWHVCVLFESAFHYFAILFYVVV
ncbi:hemolysin III [Salirhabdus euzebyi]|uniref:Hemolysin III n=1 Tax=Salirhabdus euzebyi TaxID=394506 RepID=A0A841Q970_9BACI|nr:hemolysin III family protein [Salirhabdus euzebyi]MBB6454853.1 hemolysin III [Salirhabdus euzebyi]